VFGDNGPQFNTEVKENFTKKDIGSKVDLAVAGRNFKKTNFELGHSKEKAVSEAKDKFTEKAIACTTAVKGAPSSISLQDGYDVKPASTYQQ
jgi:hypothetical protein